MDTSLNTKEQLAPKPSQEFELRPDTGNPSEQREAEQTSEQLTPSEAPEQRISGTVQALGKLGKTVQQTTTPQVIQKTPVRREIETILAAHITDMLQTMNPDQKLQFKLKAVETATLIEQLMAQAKATAKKIIHLIRDWLRLIPGVNEFYIEQEAKIKSDRILALQEDQSRQTLPNTK